MVTGGFGETNVRSTSGGGDSIETVHSVNAETKVGAINFSLPNTSDSAGKIAAWKSTPGELVIQYVDSGIQMNMSTASLSNDPEMSLTSDGDIPLEFKGNPIQIG